MNLLDASTPSRTNPRPLDLRLLLREGGPNLLEMPEPELYQRARAARMVVCVSEGGELRRGLGLGTWGLGISILVLSALFGPKPQAPRPKPLISSKSLRARLRWAPIARATFGLRQRTLVAGAG